jgi:hypothetical protein
MPIINTLMCKVLRKGRLYFFSHFAAGLHQAAVQVSANQMRPVSQVKVQPTDPE